MAIELQIGDVPLRRGNPFNVNVSFEYLGKPQVLTFGLVMKHGGLGTEYPCVPYPTTLIQGAKAWGGVGPYTLSYKVPSGVQDGGQDIRMHITTEDGKEEYSDWKINAISIY